MEVLNWYCFVKDKTALNGQIKALLKVLTFKVGEDLLTSHNSTINVLEIAENVNKGDIVCLYNPYGIVRYKGVIKAIKEKELQLTQMQSFYKGQYLINVVQNGIIESSFATMLQQYANGYSKGSSYQDFLMKLEKEPIKIKTGSQTSGNLLTPEKTTETIDMEKYIYSLYENYQILLDFNIPYGEWNIGDNNGGYVEIKKPNYAPLKIADNANCVIEITPTTEIEKTNKLIIYSKEGVYRKTYYATANGIVEEGTSIIDRVAEIETKIVFSDDELADIVKANLSEEMFNHKITFTILIDNKLYKFDDFKLGMPVEIYKGTQLYNSVITGYEIEKAENQNVISATFTCGFVRTTLTNRMKRKLGIV